MVDDEHEQETEPTDVDVESVGRHATYGIPRARVGPRCEAAGFASFQEIAIALGVTREFLSRVRHGRDVPSAHTRQQLADLLGVPEHEVLSVLREQPDTNPTPEHVDNRTRLLSVLDARIARLDAEVDDDADELRARPGPMSLHDSWTDIARDAGCSARTLMRIRRGADLPTERMIERLSRALLVPPGLVLVALRRPWTGWRW